MYVRFFRDIIPGCKIEQKFAEKSVKRNIERGSRGLDVVFVGHRTGHLCLLKPLYYKGAPKEMAGYLMVLLVAFLLATSTSCLVTLASYFSALPITKKNLVTRQTKI